MKCTTPGSVVSYRNSTSNHNAGSGGMGSHLVVSYRNSTSNHNYLWRCLLRLRVVSYRNSTSNHNSQARLALAVALYLIEILHQTTTDDAVEFPILGCILSKFYIKPQRNQPTHIRCMCCILSKFYIKPQLMANFQTWVDSCILSKFYIKPQRQPQVQYALSSCILSKFYIKPQLRIEQINRIMVVSYRNSTSNHNEETARNTTN